MSYLDVGYDSFLERPIATAETTSEFDDLRADQAFSEISGRKIRGGTLISKNGRMLIDLENNAMIATDGVTERVRFGQQEDGSAGLLIKDRNGKVIMQVTGDINVLKSPDDSLELNFNNTQLLVRDEGGTPTVLLGKF